MSGPLSLFEVEGYVRSLECLPLTAVGSDRWSTQHDHLEQLNIQAHADAQAGKHDEYVVEQFVAQDKVATLVHELLVIEAWKEKVFPLLIDHLSPVTAVKAYIVLYHEATLCNLLEVLLYHASICEVGGDAMLELGDYCVRKVNLLNAGAFKKLQEDKADDPKASLSRSTQDGLRQQLLDIGFGVAVCATSLLRFLSDHVNVLPLGVVSRLLHTHDVLLALVPLVENPPWTRRRGGRLEKFSDQRWTVVAPRDAAMMTKLEGQVWLTIYNLMMDKACRKQYQYNTHRKEVLVKLRRYFSDILMDQLPLLRELKRLIEELSIMEPPPPTASSLAIIEQIPEMREGIIRDVDWKKIAETQKSSVFANDESARQRDIARLAKTYNLDALEEVMAPPSCAECGVSNPGSMKRCSRCKNEWYCGRTCQVANWKKHQQVCDLMAKDAATTKKPTSAAAASAPSAAKPAAAAAASSTAAKPAASPAASSAKPASAAAAIPAAAKPAPAVAAAPAPKPQPVAAAASSAPAPAFKPAAAAPIAAAAPGAKKVLIEMLDDDETNPLDSPD